MKLQFLLRGLPPIGYIPYGSTRVCVVQAGPSFKGEFIRDSILFVDIFDGEDTKLTCLRKYELKRLK